MTDLIASLNAGLRAGELYQSHAYVVDARLWGEGHKRVVLLCPGAVKIVAQARYAARSVKRFGAALQAFALVNAHLKIGKGSLSFENWHLEKVELQQSFLALRSQYQKMEAAAFVWNFVRDLLPTGQLDNFYFLTVSEFIFSLNQVDESEVFYPNWWKALFWELSFRHMGYGKLLNFKEFESCQKFTDALKVFRGASVQRDLEKSELASLYVKWRENTHQSWEYIEKWLKS